MRQQQNALSASTACEVQQQHSPPSSPSSCPLPHFCAAGQDALSFSPATAALPLPLAPDTRGGGNPRPSAAPFKSSSARSASFCRMFFSLRSSLFELKERDALVRSVVSLPSPPKVANVVVYSLIFFLVTATHAGLVFSNKVMGDIWRLYTSRRVLRGFESESRVESPAFRVTQQSHHRRSQQIM